MSACGRYVQNPPSRRFDPRKPEPMIRFTVDDDGESIDPLFMESYPSVYTEDKESIKDFSNGLWRGNIVLQFE